MVEISVISFSHKVTVPFGSEFKQFPGAEHRAHKTQAPAVGEL